MKLGEYFCLSLNSILPKRKMRGRESPLSYSEWEYDDAKATLSFHTPYIDLTDKVVLDAGCGLGGKTVFYAENGCKSVVGIDMDENHIRYSNEFANKKGVLNVEFKVASLDALPFESNKFDIIFLNNVIPHIIRPILINAFEECKRVIKQDGRIYLEFLPWTGPYAGMLHDYMHIPWFQLIFSSGTIANVMKRLNPGPRYGKLSDIEHFQELNHITIQEFKDIVTELHFQFINYYEFYIVKRARILNYIPFFNKYLVSSVVAVLSK